MVADAPADRADGRERRAAASRTASPLADDRRDAPRSRAGAGRPRRSRSSTVAVSSASDSWLASSGAKAGSSGSEASTACIAADHLAEPVARGRGTPPGRTRAPRARAPSRRRRRRRTAARSRASALTSGPAYDHQPASSRHVLEAVRGEEAQQLELGVHARPRCGGRPSRSARRRPRPTSSTARRRAAARRRPRAPRPAAAERRRTRSCPPASSSIAPRRDQRATSSRANAGRPTAS